MDHRLRIERRRRENAILKKKLLRSLIPVALSLAFVLVIAKAGVLKTAPIGLRILVTLPIWISLLGVLRWLGPYQRGITKEYVLNKEPYIQTLGLDTAEQPDRGVSGETDR